MPKGIPGVIPRLTQREHDEIRGTDRLGNPLVDGDEPNAARKVEKEAPNTPEPAVEDKPATPEKFKLAEGLEFDSQEAAARAFKKLMKEQRIAQGDQSKLAREVNELKARLDSMSQRQAPGAAPDPTSDEALGIDPAEVAFQRDYIQALEYIEGLETPQERAAARAILAQNVQEHSAQQTKRMLEQMMSEKYGVINQANEHLEISQKADQAFGVVASLTTNPQDPASPPLYPELQQEEPTRRIAGAWDKMRKAGVPDEVLHSPGFIRLLVHGYRDTTRATPVTAPPPPATPPVPIPPAPTAPALATPAGYPSSSTPKATPRANPMLAHPSMRLPGVIPRL